MSTQLTAWSPQEVSTLLGNLLGIRFLFIHEGKSDDTIKNFFIEAYEFYVKVTRVCDNAT